MTKEKTGRLKKMRTESGDPVRYFLAFEQHETTAGQQQHDEIELNPLIGKSIRIEYTGRIFCCHCGRLTRKSFSQGYCYPCFSKLAQTDQCIMSPEKCHFEQGTCREPEWAEKNCMREHTVYLSNTSGLKVGITRDTQVPTRWIDQGAIQAIPVATVSRRQLAGFVENSLRQHVSDRTQWQRMLKNETEVMALDEQWQQLREAAAEELESLQQQHGESDIVLHDDRESVTLNYPVNQYPEKVKTHNFDKDPVLENELSGIKGQYLMFGNLVVNIRKYTGYEVSFSPA